MTLTATRASGRTHSVATPRRSRRLVALIVALAIWQAGSVYVGAATLPGVVPALRAFYRQAVTGQFWSAVWDTALSTVLGLAISAAVAVPLGVAIGSSRFAEHSTRLAIDVLRSVPPIALLPMALLLYGPTLHMSLVLVIYGAVWPMLVHCIYAVRDVDPIQRDVAAVFMLPRLTRWRLLILPSILPLSIVGVRLSATIALLLSIAAELIGTAPGIGAQISAAQLTGDIPRTYAYVICAGLLGVLLNALMRLLERYVISWHPSVRRARELS